MMFQAMVKECAEMYGFNAEEAIQRLALSSMKKVSAPRARGDAVKKAKKQVIPLPFNAGCIDAEGCQGLKPNHGLYTQCPSKRMSDGEYCSGCQKQCEKNESGKPNAGTVADRLSQGDEFKDPKGKRPQHFTSVMNKLKLTREMVESTGNVDESHFVVPEKKGKGRPKKSKSVVSAGGDDVFGELAMESSNQVEDDAVSASLASTVMDDEMSSLSGNESESSSKKSKKQKMSPEEKAAKEAEKEAKKAAKEADKEAKKVEMAAKKEEQAKKKAEKEAEMAAKKAEMAAKKAEKEAEKEAKKAEKEAKKAEKEAKKASKEVDVVEEEVKKVVAKKFTHNGVTYAKSGDGRVFDLTTKEFVGTWDEEKKEIIYCDEEEEEEESEEDDE
jgi:hypothetical protein